MNWNDHSDRWGIAGMISMRLCLIVSLWQAPIPWVHCHDANVCVSQSLSEATNLSNHLANFHSSGIATVESEIGWHWHWILPCWSHAIDQTPDDEPPAQEVVTFDQATISSTSLNFLLTLQTYCILEPLALRHSSRHCSAWFVPYDRVENLSVRMTPRVLRC